MLRATSLSLRRRSFGALSQGPVDWFYAKPIWTIGSHGSHRATDGRTLRIKTGSQYCGILVSRPLARRLSTRGRWLVFLPLSVDFGLVSCARSHVFFQSKHQSSWFSITKETNCAAHVQDRLRYFRNRAQASVTAGHRVAHSHYVYLLYSSNRNGGSGRFRT